jgi:hypothetical protein
MNIAYGKTTEYGENPFKQETMNDSEKQQTA